MSTNRDCTFREVEPGRWTYWLQDWPGGETTEGQTFGPFGSYAAADTHLVAHHANPGGSMAFTHPTGHVHEFETRPTQVIVGRTLTVDVESLGPDATDEDVIRLVTTLTADHPAFQVRTKYGLKDVTACLACGAHAS